MIEDLVIALVLKDLLDLIIVGIIFAIALLYFVVKEMRRK